MKIGIVGWGVEGQSIYRYFGPGHSYLIANEQPADDFPAESELVKLQFLKDTKGYGLRGSIKDLSYLDGIESCDKIVYSPTAYFNLQKKYDNNKDFWAKATTGQHIFFEEVKTKNIIGVTGTKGKGTTSTLIFELLKAEGKEVFLGGNIGTPVLDLVRDIEPDDWVVLELANFQLRSLDRSPHIAVCLIVTPEHLDWHPDMEDYLEAKASLFRYQKPDDIAIYFSKNENSKKIAFYSPGNKVPYFESPGARIRGDGMVVIGNEETEIIHKSEVKLLGEHNLQNICAACTAVFEAVGNLDKAKAVLSSFSGLEHRLELVRELQGIKFYNDSFAATPDASIGAIEAISGPKIMILGGFDRHLPLSPLAQAINQSQSGFRKILLIGQSAKRLADELQKAEFTNYEILTVKTMPEIVAAARTYAQAGDSVVLSPGFASFDMFKDFEVRGSEFKKAVQEL
ncbi:MAG TPA: UDP-N-acetylmuramoyl-L-alanine--D-glutamate ligase [Candidatus Saccharimonadales bacterium]|nr:UDP-N-acetylmuramoyl-L-alanine--D-glutamate ligase [Candidatus Saccharimonadales bacterium]